MTSRPGWSRLLAEQLSGSGPSVHLQPIVDLQRGTIVGYESLARFPGAAVSDPEAWFTAARRHGRGADLEAAALRAAFASRELLPVNTFLTVNVGPDVLASPQVREVLAAQGSLAGVVIELTEQAPIDSYVVLEPVLDWVRGLGAMLAIDDCGSGYAGLRHLLGIRPDFIKLDRDLISGIDTDEAKRALVETVGLLASRLDAWMLAEGLETTAELDVLARMGVPLAQGYLLGRPASGCADLDPDLSLRLIGMSREHGQPSLRTMLEQTAVCARSEDAAGMLEQDAVDFVVVVDRDARPVMTLDSHGVLRSMADGLRVNLDTPVPSAAQRAIARRRGQRFEPLVCIDTAGRYVGIVRMERLVDVLSRSATRNGTETGTGTGTGHDIGPALAAS